MNSSTASKVDELPGLEGARRLVRAILERPNGVHAVLFYGAKGSGVEELGLHLAQAWLCTGPDDCQACQAFERGRNPDYLRIEPAGPSAIIRLNAIANETPREDDPLPIAHFFRTAPLYSRNKVVFMADAHRMNNDAANALLKMLEEPHPYGKLILTTDSLGGLPQTILSRCLGVACELPPSEALAAMNAPAPLMLMADGSPGRLRTMLAAPEAFLAIAEFAERIPRLDRGMALVASDDLREISAGVEKASGLGARAANALTLELLAFALGRGGGEPHHVHAVIEAHRRILGNGSASLVFDALGVALVS